MFYDFKPAKAGKRWRSTSRKEPAKSRVRLGKVVDSIRAFVYLHSGIGKLITVITLAMVGAVIAGTLFHQGIFRVKPTVFKLDLNNTVLEERITAPQGIAKQHALDLYLDSLDKAITADSIRSLETQKIQK